MKKRTKRRLTYGGSSFGLRRAEYSQKTTGYLPNAFTMGYRKYKASPGDLVIWRYKTADGERDAERHFGRMLAMVNAPREGEECPAVKGHIAVLELDISLSHCFVRWVDPDDVCDVTASPEHLVAWFFGDAPRTWDLETILRLSHRGSLSEPYIESVRACPECDSLLSLGGMKEGGYCSEPKCNEAEREKEHAEWRAERELARKQKAEAEACSE
jgi:hypothetical protein